jgi:PadR family transcriptional regulator PadR
MRCGADWELSISAVLAKLVKRVGQELCLECIIVIVDNMSREFLGNFELMVLLAVLRLEDDAYGVPIANAIEESTGRDVIQASVYNALERLEEKGLVSSRLGEPTAERGGKAKKYFRITAKGLREVKATRNALTRLWKGIPALEGGTA